MKLELSVDEMNALFWALDEWVNNNPIEEAQDEEDQAQIKLVTQVYDRVSDVYVEDAKQLRKLLI